MERKEELLWKKLRVQVTPNQQSLKNRRGSPNLLHNIDLSIINNIHHQLEEPNSPTFKREISVKQQPKEHQSSCFSFGQKMLQQLQHMLRQSGNIQKSSFLPVCVHCQSFCTSEDKISSSQNLKQVLAKLSRFVYDTKYFIEGVKLSLKNYRQSFESQKSYWLSYVSLILGNIDSKTTKERSEFQSRIKQLQQQKNFSVEKSKLLQKRALTLEQQVTDMALSLNSQRLISQQMNKKVHELNQQLQGKITQITNLMEENMNMKINLKKFMNYANEVTTNTLQLACLSNCEEDLYQFKQKSRQKTQQNFIRSRKQSISSVVTQTNSNNKEFLIDFAESVTMNSARKQQCQLGKPITKRNSHQNPKILQQRQRNCGQQILFLVDNKNKLSPKLKSEELNGSRQRRNSDANSSVSNARYNLYGNNLTQTKKNSICDKSNLMEKIKKLKEDINFQIRDLQSPN